MRKINVYKFSEKMPDVGIPLIIIPKEREKDTDTFCDFYIGKMYDVIKELQEELELEDDPEEKETLKKVIEEKETNENRFKIEWLDSDGAIYADTDVNDILKWEWVEYERR